MELNRNMTNEQILANADVKKALDEGKIVIIDKVQTSNPDYTNLYFIGKVEGLSSSNTGVSQLAAALLNWGEVHMRSIQNAATKIAEQLQIGQAIDGTIRVVDSIEPSFDDQTPREDREGKLLLHNGQKIYRSTSICTHDELAASGHSTLEVHERIAQGQNAGQKQSQGVGNEGTSNSSPVSNLIAGNA